MPFMTGMMMSRSTKFTLSGNFRSISRAFLPLAATIVSYLSRRHKMWQEMKISVIYAYFRRDVRFEVGRGWGGWVEKTDQNLRS